MGEEAEYVQAIVDRDDHHSLRGQMGAVIFRLRCGAEIVAAAVDPDHHRQPVRRRFRRRPDVQVETVLAHPIVEGIEIAETIALHASRAPALGVSNARPGRDGLRRPPPPRADRRRCVREALEDANAGGVGSDVGDQPTLNSKRRRSAGIDRHRFLPPGSPCGRGRLTLAASRNGGGPGLSRNCDATQSGGGVSFRRPWSRWFRRRAALRARPPANRAPWRDGARGARLSREDAPFLASHPSSAG